MNVGTAQASSNAPNPTDSAVALLPCPFCGQSCAVLTNTREMERPSSCFMYTVVCDATQDGCGMTVGYEFEADDAIKRWQTRSPAREGGDAVTEADRLLD